MCLSIPAKVIETNGQNATVDVFGNKMSVGIGTKENVKEGDYVILQYNVIVEVLDKSTAEESLRAWKNILDLK